MEELDRLYRVFREKQIGRSIPEFLDFVRREYSASKKGGVVPYEVRLEKARLKQIESYQREAQPPTPENDLDNL